MQPTVSLVTTTIAPRTPVLTRPEVVLALSHHGVRAHSHRHVQLTPAQPERTGRGWLEWHDERLEIWLEGLTPGSRYLLAVDVTCLGGAGSPEFHVSSSAATPMSTVAQSPDQTLLLVIAPDDDLALVAIRPHDLQAWSLHGVTVTKAG